MINPQKKSLRSRAVKGSLTVLSGDASQQVIRLASNLILTRLLMPEQFGLVALASVFLMWVTLLSDVGLNTSVVQSKRGDDPDFLNTAWTLQIIRGFVIWLLAVIAALALIVSLSFNLLPIDSVYAAPDLPYVIIVLSGTAIIAGLFSTNLATGSRHLQLGKIVTIKIAAQCVGALVMVGLAITWKSVWVLVVGSFVTYTIILVLSHAVLSGQRNRLRWHHESVRQIFDFGKWIFVSSSTGFFASNGDRIILAGLFDPSSFGIYVIARQILQAILNLFSQLGHSIVFPALSEVFRDRAHDLKRTFYRVRVPLDAAVLLLAGFLLLTGEVLVNFLYDDRYALAGTFLSVLSIRLFAIIHLPALLAIVAVGQPRFNATVAIVDAVSLFLVPIVASQRFETIDILWMIVLSSLVSRPLIYRKLYKLKLLNPYYEVMIFAVYPAGLLLGWVFLEFTNFALHTWG